MRKHRRLSIETLEERTNPASTAIGQGVGVFEFNVAGFSIRQDNADFATTSSAFGFIEASMTAAAPVDTSAGGTISASLGDAFDGALSWGITGEGSSPTQTTYVDSDGVVDVTPAPTDPGNMTTTTSGTILTGDPQSVGSDGNTFNGLHFQQQNAVFTVNGDPVIRTILFVTNPTDSLITQEIGNFNNLGSDTNTEIFTTSDGDTTFSDGSDRWYVSFQSFGKEGEGEGQAAALLTSSDPRLLLVLQGNGVVASPVGSNGTIVNGNDDPSYLYTLTVNPGETQALMIFVGLHQSRAEAAAMGATFDANSSVIEAGLVADLSQAQLGLIQNWDFPAPVDTPTLPPELPPPVVISPTEEGSFIERLYHDLLGRRPDSYADQYVQDLENGSRSKLDVAFEVANSDEHLGRLVNGLYRKYLGRAADEASLTSYVDAIQDGKGIEDVTIEILTSPEYRSQSISGADFVTQLFKDVLGRPPSTEDLNVYLAKYGNGSQAEVESVVREIVQSKEARGIAVDSAYLLLLNRPADEPSRTGYVGDLEVGRSILDILAELAASDEYSSSNLLI